MLRPQVRRAFRLAIRRADRTEADVEEELRGHLELRIEQLVARGWTRADADAEARRRFGPSWGDAVRQLHQAGHCREERLAMRERLHSLRQDVRWALRALRGSPRFTIAAVLTLALGLGAATVIFSLADHVVLRPLVYADADRLVVVREIVGSLRDKYPTMAANASHFLEWRRACTACEALAAIKRSATTLSGTGDPQRLGALRVSANLFALLGTRPALGRGFRDDEDQPGRDQVAVISDGLWQRQFGGDRQIIGRTVVLSGASIEIVGVLPPDFAVLGGDAMGRGAGLPREVDVYRPLALTEREVTTKGEFDYVVLARLRPGATVVQARAQMDAVLAPFAQRRGSSLNAVVVPLHEQVVGSASRPLLLLLGAVGALLLIVCVNVANLSLARNASRRRESAVRLALGAGRAQLARLTLAESLTVALTGGALGLVVAAWGLRALVALAPATLPRIAEVRLDGRIVAVATVLTLVVGLLIGLLPAIHTGRTGPAETLKGGGRTSTGSRSAARGRALFIGAQVAGSTVLLVGAGLFLTSLVRVLGVDRGFDTTSVLAVNVALSGPAYEKDEARAQFYDRALTELAAMPGVVGAAVASALPLEGENWVDAVSTEDAAGAGRDPSSANFRFVSPAYFSAMGTPLRGGRTFGDGDRQRKVVVLSERAAHTLWPREDAVGKQVRVFGGAAEVVGVAANVATSTLEQEGSLVVYFPAWTYPPAAGTLVVRTTTDPASVTTAVRAAVRRVDPAVPVSRVRTMAQVVSDTVAARRFQLGVLALFAVMALITASVGIYGVIAQSLAGRTGEIGVRMALGARPADVHRLVLREGLGPATIGLGLGLSGALAAGRAIASLLFEVRPSDPLTLAGVAALLTALAVIACLVPARRATRAGLATMLRLE